jgi:DNA-binding Xre family transcriptional regulator
MSLATALAALAAARGMTPAEVADSVAGTQNRATFYRALNGETVDPRLSTLVNVCEVLDVTPAELLRVAGLLEDPAGALAPVDLGLRQALGAVQTLGEDDRRLIVTVVRSFVQERGPKASARRQRSARAEPAAERGDGSA